MDCEELQRELIQLAQSVAAARGWDWLEPIETRLACAAAGKRTWQVRTNINAKGRNIRIVIREADLKVIHAAWLPR